MPDWLIISIAAIAGGVIGGGIGTLGTVVVLGSAQARSEEQYELRMRQERA